MSRPPRPRGAALAALLALALAPASPAAQDRPSEDELFGAPPTEEKPPREAPPASSEQPGDGPRPEEAEIFGSTGSPNALPPPPEGVVSRERDDTLRVGGQLYVRGATSWQEGVDPEDWTLASPNLLDLYVDARPNERVRAFVLGRMSYDPTLDGDVVEPGLADLGLVLGGERPDNPDAVLDQLWVNFDVGRRVFVTAGKQHVKWGVGKFWNPTDYLHSVRRDPLAVFDPRTGTTMVKLHVPWEARGWNAYGVLVLDDTAARPVATRRLGRLGAGGRVEAVLGTMEVGLDALLRDGRRPRFGADVSFGVWELDLYAEAALRSGGEIERWALDGTTLRRVDHDGLTPQLVLGGSWSRNYTDDDVFTVGAEYFYDDTGYDDATIYPYLLAVPVVFGPEEPSPFSPFYLGRHQAGAFLSLPAPGSWNDTTFTLSALGNLSDRSLVVRLDHSVLANTYLRVETYVAGHLGARRGEHRLGLDVAGAFPGVPLPPGVPGEVPPAVLDLGIALRVAL